MKRMTAGLLIGLAMFSICGTAAAGTDIENETPAMPANPPDD